MLRAMKAEAVPCALHPVRRGPSSIQRCSAIEMVVLRVSHAPGRGGLGAAE